MGSEQFVLAAIDDVLDQGAVEIAQRMLEMSRTTLRPDRYAHALKRILAAGGRV